MNRTAIVVAALVCGSAAAAPVGQQVTFDGDLGCDTLQTQLERMSALKVAMQTSAMKAQRNASPARLKLNDEAVQKFTTLSRERCRKLAGPFDVLERKKIEGGSVVRVGFGSGSLWVLMK